MTTKSHYVADIIGASLRGGKTMTLFRAIIAVFLFGFTLAGCGQSGPLYLPGNPSQVQSVNEGQPAAQAPQTQNDDDEEDEHDNDGG